MMKKYFVVVLMMLACSPDNNDPKPVTPVEDEFDQYGTPFAGVADTQEIVLYEINTRAFSEAGNFQGVIDRLDDISDLGVNTIWLMPIHPVGQIRSAGGLGSPYSVKDYMGVNAEFGDLTKLRELVDKAHAKNIAVLIDWVANHTAWDNPWINNKSWYSQDASGNIIIPAGTNWQDVADLNFNNGEMRKAMIRAMEYWILEANIDGFRCDAVDFVPTDFWKQALDKLKAIEGRKLILLAEGGRASDFSAGFQMNYGWDFYNNMKQVYKTSSPNSASTIFSVHQAEYNSIPAGARKLRYTTNHDESAWEATPVEFFGGINGALSASVITIFTSSVPLIYSGQEVGQTERLPFFTRDPIDWNANQSMLQQYEKLFSIYNSTDVFTKGSLESYAVTDIAAFKRIFEGSEYLIFVNVRSSQKMMSLPVALQGGWTNAMSDAPVTLGETLSLQAYEYLILKK
jgi:glycosidase